jgi:cysteine desulfuration protein SufE|tara:strand:- start:4200 stop:4829 length:630 start_codon:yes stop_codon:yes gene_type:complete
MYIKGGMKKLSKAIAKSSKEAFDKEIAIAQQEEDQINQMMEEQEKANMPVLNEDRKLVELDDGSKLDDMSIKEKIGTWKHNFSQLDPHNKFFYLLEQGRGIVELDDTKRINGYRVYGCVSQVWVLPSLKDEKMIFEVDADSHEARGVMYILQSIFSGHAPLEILEVTDQEIIDIGFFETLNEKRREGTFAVVNAIRTYAKDMVEMLSDE